MSMNVESLTYPVLCFSQYLVKVNPTMDSLLTCSRLALRKGGFYENLLVVDSSGIGMQIKGAEKVHGIGLFWGYNIFLNQKIRIKLRTDNGLVKLSLADVKQRVFRSFERWHGWSSRGDFDQLKASIERAASIREIISLLS